MFGSLGFDVISIRELCSGIDEEKIINKFLGEDAVIITPDTP